MSGCTSTGPSGNDVGAQKHVVLISVDGMHDSDLAGFIAAQPQSALAKLAGRGVHYISAQNPSRATRSPAFSPRSRGKSQTTGVYYDDSYAHDLLEAGTTNCSGAKTGAAVSFTEELDKDTTKIDGGEGLPNLPNGVLKNDRRSHPCDRSSQAAG